ncbi:hypothetical protein [Parasediminibacterium paludis]
MKLSFWQWVGVVIILSMILGFFLRYRAIKSLAEIEKAKAANSSNTTIKQ